MSIATSLVMGARNHDELICWQLSVEFRDRVIALLATAPFKRRFKFCDQLHDAVESIPANIAEGFYRYSHAEIARFFRIALGSLGEAETRLGSAKAQGLLQQGEYDFPRRLAIRTRAAATRFVSSLGPTPQLRAKQRRSRPPRAEPT
jgi:four helix bundle protein